MAYVPEIGQMAYGQPWQELECPDWIVASLEVLRDALIDAKDIDPFGNTGDEFICEAFHVEAYSWGDEPQPWNFKWGDIEISWYKWLGRGTTINREIDRATAHRMLTECLASINS